MIKFTKSDLEQYKKSEIIEMFLIAQEHGFDGFSVFDKYGTKSISIDKTTKAYLCDENMLAIEDTEKDVIEYITLDESDIQLIEEKGLVKSTIMNIIHEKQ